MLCSINKVETFPVGVSGQVQQKFQEANRQHEEEMCPHSDAWNDSSLVTFTVSYSSYHPSYLRLFQRNAMRHIPCTHYIYSTFYALYVLRNKLDDSCHIAR